MPSLYESVCRRLLREASKSMDSVVTTGLAAVVEDLGNTKKAVVYNIDKLKAAAAAGRLDFVAKDSYVVGFVEIGKPRGANCRGAWMIRGIAGPGALVYGMAYALSPTGLIVPDRSEVSPSAKNAWMGYFKSASSSGNALPLDDADHPKTGTDASHDKYHTKDESDDCYTSHEESYLNYAYRGPGGESALLDRLYAAHENVIASIASSAKTNQEDMEAAVVDAGYSFFDYAKERQPRSAT